MESMGNVNSHIMSCFLVASLFFVFSFYPFALDQIIKKHTTTTTTTTKMYLLFAHVSSFSVKKSANASRFQITLLLRYKCKQTGMIRYPQCKN